jgi:hypothetical protein
MSIAGLNNWLQHNSLIDGRQTFVNLNECMCCGAKTTTDGFATRYTKFSRSIQFRFCSKPECIKRASDSCLYWDMRTGNLPIEKIKENEHAILIPRSDGSVNSGYIESVLINIKPEKLETMSKLSDLIAVAMTWKDGEEEKEKSLYLSTLLNVDGNKEHLRNFFDSIIFKDLESLNQYPEEIYNFLIAVIADGKKIVI